jgi:hypothetical protein
VRAGKRIAVGAGVVVSIAVCWGIQHAASAGGPLRGAATRIFGRPSSTDDGAALALRLDTVLDAEALDAEWSQAAVRRIGAFFESDRAKGASVGRIDCKSTLCRVAITYDSVEARVRSFHELSRLTPPQLVYFFYVRPATPLSTIVYLPREGHPLPLDEPGWPMSMWAR